MTREPRYFVHYLKKSTCAYMKHDYAGEGEKHDASDLFRRRGVEPGDFLYEWSYWDAKLFLVGRMQVGRFISQKEADALYRPTGDSAWKASDHVLARRSTATPMSFDRTIPLDVVRRLEFVSSAGKTRAKFVGGTPDPQTFRGLRQLTRHSAHLLDQVIDSNTSAAPPSQRGKLKSSSAVTDLTSIFANPHYSPTTKKRLSDARLGQGEYRKKVERIWGGCAVKGIRELRLLRASHLKPWKVSSDDERLDPYNGLLLIPNFDLALDGGYISFQDNGRILISSRLDRTTSTKMGIHANLKLRHVRKEHRPYLRYHRREIFQQ